MEHILLTEQQAAEILQPHMRTRSALHWLKSDRSNSPILPFEIKDGIPCYRDVDLIRFITTSLNPDARFARTDEHLYNDKRYIPERRLFKERRKNINITLAPHLERRKAGNFDRRAFTNFNRRTTT